MQKKKVTGEQLLKDHGLRKTAMRLEVLEVFLNHLDTALSHQDIEKELEDNDRVTLYRTLKSFEAKGLIHQAIDGSGLTKYALCDVDCTEHQHIDDHPHFHCTECGKTSCLEDHTHLDIKVPSGYTVANAHVVIQGSCDQCN